MMLIYSGEPQEELDWKIHYEDFSSIEFTRTESDRLQGAFTHVLVINKNKEGEKLIFSYAANDEIHLAKYYPCVALTDKDMGFCLRKIKEKWPEEEE